MSAGSGGSPVNMGYVRGATAATTFALTAGATLKRIYVKNNNANAVTGGLKFGSTLAGTDIVAALAIGASVVVDATPLIPMTNSAGGTVYIDAVVSWNSANVDIAFEYVKAF